MAISKRFELIVKQANVDGDITPIINELNRLKDKNYRTYITTVYSVNKLVKDEWKDKFVNSEDDLKKYQELAKPNNKIEQIVGPNLIEDIYCFGHDPIFMDCAFNLLAYVLLNTGRRVSEILENPYKVKNNELYIILNKKKDRVFAKIEILLDNDANKTASLIKRIREIIDGRPFKKMASNFGYYMASFRFENGDSLSPHSLRGIYAKYIYKFRNPNHLSQGMLIDSVLNQGQVGSSKNYDYIDLSMVKDDIFIGDVKCDKSESTDCVPTTVDLSIPTNKMTVKALRQMCKDRNIQRYSKANKPELLMMLSD